MNRELIIIEVVNELTMRKIILYLVCLPLFSCDNTPEVLFEIGKEDHSYLEFALAPDKYTEFLSSFTGEKGVYKVGYSKPEKDWPYVLPGPNDSWAARYWNGYGNLLKGFQFRRLITLKRFLWL